MSIRVLMAFLACMIAIMNISFLEPIISLRVKEFGYRKEISGFVFTAMTIPYMIACPFVSKAMKKYPKKNIMVIAFILLTIFSTMFGPSKILMFPNNIWVIILGFVLSGFTLSFCFLPACPEMIETSQELLNTNHPKLNDICSALFNFAFGMGALLGPQLSTIYT